MYQSLPTSLPSPAHIPPSPNYKESEIKAFWETEINQKSSNRRWTEELRKLQNYLEDQPHLKGEAKLLHYQEIAQLEQNYQDLRNRRIDDLNQSCFPCAQKLLGWLSHEDDLQTAWLHKNIQNGFARQQKLCFPKLAEAAQILREKLPLEMVVSCTDPTPYLTELHNQSYYLKVREHGLTICGIPESGCLLLQISYDCEEIFFQKFNIQAKKLLFNAEMLSSSESAFLQAAFEKALSPFSK